MMYFKSHEKSYLVKAAQCALSLNSTCVIADFSPRTPHTVKAALRSAFLHRFPCTGRTRCAAYRHWYLHFEAVQSHHIICTVYTVYRPTFKCSQINSYQEKAHTHLISLSSAPQNSVHVDVKLATRAL